MAEGKKTVLLYVDVIHTVEMLTDDQAGKLFKHFLRYVNDQNPTAEDHLTGIVFEPWKQQLKRDLKKYEKRAERSRENGAKGGRPPKQAKPKPTIKKTDPVDYNGLLKTFNEITGKSARVVNDKTKAQIKARLKEGYTKKDIWNALQNVVKDSYHVETNLKYVTLEFITRPDKIDKFVNVKTTKKGYDPNF